MKNLLTFKKSLDTGRVLSALVAIYSLLSVSFTNAFSFEDLPLAYRKIETDISSCLDGKDCSGVNRYIATLERMKGEGDEAFYFGSGSKPILLEHSSQADFITDLFSVFENKEVVGVLTRLDGEDEIHDFMTKLKYIAQTTAGASEDEIRERIKKAAHSNFGRILGDQEISLMVQIVDQLATQPTKWTPSEVDRVARRLGNLESSSDLTRISGSEFKISQNLSSDNNKMNNGDLTIGNSTNKASDVLSLSSFSPSYYSSEEEYGMTSSEVFGGSEESLEVSDTITESTSEQEGDKSGSELSKAIPVWGFNNPLVNNLKSSDSKEDMSKKENGDLKEDKSEEKTVETKEEIKNQVAEAQEETLEEGLSEEKIKEAESQENEKPDFAKLFEKKSRGEIPDIMGINNQEQPNSVPSLDPLRSVQLPESSQRLGRGEASIMSQGHEAIFSSIDPTWMNAPIEGDSKRSSTRRSLTSYLQPYIPSYASSNQSKTKVTSSEKSRRDQQKAEKQEYEEKQRLLREVAEGKSCERVRLVGEDLKNAQNLAQYLESKIQLKLDQQQECRKVQASLNMFYEKIFSIKSEAKYKDDRSLRVLETNEACAQHVAALSEEMGELNVQTCVRGSAAGWMAVKSVAQEYGAFDISDLLQGRVCKGSKKIPTFSENNFSAIYEDHLKVSILEAVTIETQSKYRACHMIAGLEGVKSVVAATNEKIAKGETTFTAGTINKQVHLLAEYGGKNISLAEKDVEKLLSIEPVKSRVLHVTKSLKQNLTKHLEGFLSMLATLKDYVSDCMKINNPHAEVELARLRNLHSELVSLIPERAQCSELQKLYTRYQDTCTASLLNSQKSCPTLAEMEFPVLVKQNH